MLYAFAFLRYGRLSDAIAAHATTNALLAGHLDIFLPEDFRAFRGLVQDLRATAKGAPVLPRTSSTETPG